MRLGPHLHRIGNDIVAAYLIVTDQGITLVDAGLSGQFADLEKELKSIGRSLADIRGVILTHGDGDHIGFAERLRRDHGVPVYVHSADAARARGEVKTSPGFGSFKITAVASFLAYAARKGGLRTRYVTEISEVQDGQVLDLPGSPRIIGMPGHSPGSIAVYSAEADAVFVGDALTTKHVLTGRKGPQPAPFTDDPAEALASLDRLKAVEATWVLPGHGIPWGEGIPEAVRLVQSASDSAR